MDVQIPPETRKNVLFLGTLKGQRFSPRASGFVVSVEDSGFRFFFVVTARHCVAGLYASDDEVCLRLNREDGGLHHISVRKEEWWFHEQSSERAVDVAVLPIPLDRSAIVFAHIPMESMFATEEIIRKNEVGPGDEVFINGLFTNHHGTARNIPVTRIGHIAAMPEEPIKTQMGSIDAYLIEAMSIGGLSGSPVFVHLVSGRTIKNITVHRASEFYLLGLVHGHFDVRNLNDDAVVSDRQALGNIHTGIGIVIPAQDIYETIMQTSLMRFLRGVADRANARASGIPQDATAVGTVITSRMMGRDDQG
jgi:hypothetical protein